MVFAVNAAQTGDNTFSAFQARAMQLNGTATGTPTASGSSPTQTGAATQMSTGGPGLAVGLASFVVGMLLM
jgi:hypothetical protein